MDLLAHLDAYVATADEASFSRAADRLGIAQPLLSRRIKTLEEHFGGLLFDRSRRRITTTELGILLLPYARDVLDRAQRLRQAAGAAGRARIRAVGVPPHCAPAALARAIRAGADRGITLGIRELPPQERASGLADGSLSYALVRVLPERGAFRVPLGLASAPEEPGGKRLPTYGGSRVGVRPAGEAELGGHRERRQQCHQRNRGARRQGAQAGVEVRDRAPGEAWRRHDEQGPRRDDDAEPGQPARAGPAAEREAEDVEPRPAARRGRRP